MISLVPRPICLQYNAIGRLTPQPSIKLETNLVTTVSLAAGINGGRMGTGVYDHAACDYAACRVLNFNKLALQVIRGSRIELQGVEM